MADMTPSEINEAVARKLGTPESELELHHKWIKFRTEHPIPALQPQGGPYLYSRIPDYCHSIEAAWEIMDWLVYHGYHVSLWRVSKGHPWAFSCSKRPDHSDSADLQAIGDIASMAICLAFLKLP